MNHENTCQRDVPISASVCKRSFGLSNSRSTEQHVRPVGSTDLRILQGAINGWYWVCREMLGTYYGKETRYG